MPKFLKKISLTFGLMYRKLQRGQLFKKNYDLNLKRIFAEETHYVPSNSHITTKSDIRERPHPKPIKNFIRSTTSGSTGEPLTFYRDKKSVYYEYQIYDYLYTYYANNDRFKTARISSVPISNAENSSLVGLYLVMFKRLQLSSKHISEKYAFEYFSLLKKYQPELGTGYATGWYDLAVVFDSLDLSYHGFNSIVTDSSGLSYEEQKYVEKVFNTKVIQTYGLSETGMVAVQCSQGVYHPLSRIECSVYEHGEIKKYGEGELLITDLLSSNYPYVNYKTGDIGIISKNNCSCEFKTDQIITKIIGRVDDFILLPNGTKLRGGLTRIINGIEEVSKAQIIQKKSQDIQVIVRFKKDVENKKEIIDKIYRRSLLEFPGLSIFVEEGDNFYYTKAGKFKYIVREG